jgi:hypothetical protein
VGEDHPMNSGICVDALTEQDALENWRLQHPSLWTYPEVLDCRMIGTHIIHISELTGPQKDQYERLTNPTG